MDEAGLKASIPPPGTVCSGPRACRGNGGALDACARKGGQRQGAHGADRRDGLRRRDPAPARTIEKIQADYVKWGRVVKDANIRAD